METQLAAAQNKGTGVATAPERNAFEQYSEAANKNKIVGDLLKFNKGQWYAGQNEDEVATGTKLVANMDEAMVGWVKWEGGKPVDMQMGRISEAFVPPKRKELGDDDQTQWETDDQTGAARDPWVITNYLIMKTVEGSQLYTFATSSKGGINAIGRLCGAYGKHMRQKPDDFPVVALTSDSYKHTNKSYGRIHVPDFEIEGWAPKSEFEDALTADAAAGQGDADEGASEPATQAATTKKPRASAAATQF